ncbi:phage tail terminator protein [Acidimangrovimonas sediminis]|uniref:phage tail terminator protein n=1 Tax=Acidimangrovimonas sediminis TaxID=2056283 RepID=UPI000C7FECB8|nr:hypothetical protein [Acidimangrovimonas sediminis]
MLTEILDHLKAALPAQTWADVLIAENIDEVSRLAGQVDTKTAIVMPWRERAGRQELATGGFEQLVETQFLIGIVVRDFDQMMGADRATQFDALKTDVETALAGWTPAGFEEPCELVGGESSPVTTGVSIYAQTWATSRFLTGD